MSKKPDLRGIPTMYRGRLFRSRNEARFACLFDELLVPWQYEPIDLNGYVPDFIVHADLLAEIKPDLDDDSLLAAKQKIEQSGWTGEAVILSPLHEDSAHFPLVGWFGDLVDGPDGKQLEWSDCRVMRCIDCGLLSFFPDCGSWHCRRCSSNDGNAHVGAIGDDYRRAWNESGNRTQWRPQ